MAKILIGFLAAIVIAVAGFFGFQLYAQHRAAAEVEAAFEQIRSSGAKASHGEVTFDVLKRTLSVADIQAQSAAQPPVSVKIGSFTASGVGQPDATHFTADQIDATDVEVGGANAEPAGWRVSYKAPRITVKDFSGPAGMERPPASSSVIDLYRFALAQFAGISASSVSIPSLNGSSGLSAAASVTSDATYSDLVLEGIKDGKIATTKLASVAIASNAQQAGNTSKFAGTIENLVSSDIDTTALAAVLDPQNANDDSYHRVYRQISSGAYTLTLTVPPGQATADAYRRHQNRRCRVAPLTAANLRDPGTDSGGRHHADACAGARDDREDGGVVRRHPRRRRPNSGGLDRHAAGPGQAVGDPVQSGKRKE